MNDVILIESPTFRSEKMKGMNNAKSIDHLNKAKALTMAVHQGVGIASTRQMAEYYEVPVETVKTALMRHRDEFSTDGVKELKGEELEVLRSEGSDGLNLSESTTRLIAWTPRAALRLGMLLRDSPIAKAVRTVLLDTVETATQPRPTHDLAIRKIDLQIEIAKLELAKLELQREVYNSPIQQELNLDIEQRFKQSQKELLLAKTLENERKAAEIQSKLKVSVDVYQRIAAHFTGQAITSRDLIRKRICKTAIEGESVLSKMAEFGLGVLTKTSKDKPMLQVS